MKIVSPKKSNRIYMAFTIISVIMFAFFFTTNYWMSLTVKSKSDGYDTTLKLNDYNIKITDASCHDNICEFTLKCRKINDASKQYYPMIKSVKFDDGIAEYGFVTGEKYDEFSQVITVNEPPKEFTYMRVYIESAMPDVVYEDSYNEFGELVSGYTEKGKVYSRTVIIDKNDMAVKHIEPSIGYAAESVNESETTSFSSSTTATTTVPAVYMSTTTITEKPTATQSSTTKVTSSEHPTAAQQNEVTEQFQQGQAAAQNGGYSPNNYEIYNNEPAYNPDETAAQTTQNIQQTNAPATAAPPQTTTKITTTTQPHASAIKLVTDFSDNNIKLEIGKTSQIKADISPSNAIDKSVKWESNRPDIAKVDDNGKVTAESKGKAIITATTSDGGLTASCMVTVN